MPPDVLPELSQSFLVVRDAEAEDAGAGRVVAGGVCRGEEHRVRVCKDGNQGGRVARFRAEIPICHDERGGQRMHD